MLGEGRLATIEERKTKSFANASCGTATCGILPQVPTMRWPVLIIAKQPIINQELPVFQNAPWAQKTAFTILF